MYDRVEATVFALMAEGIIRERNKESKVKIDYASTTDFKRWWLKKNPDVLINEVIASYKEEQYVEFEEIQD